MSIMAHRVKVLDWSTFRMNLSVTQPYNADFEGDEMNLHVPQSLTAKAEAMENMMSHKNIVSAQSNRPVMGIVQDSLLGAAILTRRDTFLNKEQFMNLLFWIDEWDGVMPVPAITKPDPTKRGKFTPLWTGKQVMSMFLPNINSKTRSTQHPKDGEKWPQHIAPMVCTALDHTHCFLLLLCLVYTGCFFFLKDTIFC